MLCSRSRIQGCQAFGSSKRLAILLMCSCGHAQVLADNGATDARLEEVVVTAEKRESDIQRTSVAVTAFSQRMLDDLDIRELTDFQNFVPSLVFSRDNSEFKVSIRGVGSDDVGINSQPGVALHLDGVFIGRASGFNAATYDIQRIEVLRGPQGTLYGRNSTGGTINVHSQPPDYELSGIGDVRFGSYDEVRLRGALNVPFVKDTAAARVTIVSEDRDGYERNLYPGGTEGGDADNTYWRAQFLLEPTDDLRLILRASQFESRGVGPSRERLQTPADAQREAADEIIEDPELNTVWKDTAEQQSVDLDLYSLQADWELSFATLTALASYGESNFEWIADADQNRGRATDPDGYDFVLGAAPIASEQTLGELRLTSVSPGPFEWLLGAFYFNEDASMDFFLMSDSLNTGRFNGLIDSVSIISNPAIETTSYAGFGQFSYAFGADEQFKLIAGARYTHDEADGELYDRVDLSLPPPGFSIIADETLSETWSETTWKIGADWQMSETSLLYATISTGFRAGGLNFEASSPDEAIYDPEDLTAYEIGSKNRFLDDRLQLNLAAFYYDYEDFQTFQIVDGALFIENAAEVSNYGLEAELAALVTSAFAIDAHASFQHGRFDSFLSGDPLYRRGPDGIRNSGDELYDLSGNHIPNNPDFSGHLGAQYTWSIGNLGSLAIRGQTYYQTEVYSRAFNLEVGKQDSFTRSSVQARFDGASERWYLVGGVNNIEDDDVLANIAIAGGGQIVANVAPPRTWYVGFGFQF